MRGTVCSRTARRPVIHVIVPSATPPASASMRGASAARRIAHGRAPATASCAVTRYSSPAWLTVPSRTSGARTARYSFMWLYGFANESPNIPSMTIWWERPMPSTKRPRDAAAAEGGCGASTTGGRGNVGTTAVPSSMRVVSRAHRAAAMIASMAKMFANHPLANPSASARRACAMSPSTSPASPPISPMPTPIRMGGALAPNGVGAYAGLRHDVEQAEQNEHLVLGRDAPVDGAGVADAL